MADNYQKILVAIHGIGAQHRNATIRSVAYRFGARENPPLASQPLGYYHSEVRDAVTVHGLDLPENLQPELRQLGFAEVFWADVPQTVEAEKRTLEETKAWARTVVGRVRSVLRGKAAGHDLQTEDYDLAADVFEQIIETVYVIENLLFIAEKAGLFRFDLKKMLDEYLGDVQLVTEFAFYRNEIVGRFHHAMEQIHQQHPGAKLYVVAHSEGTVVSFLALLQALAGKRSVLAEKEPSCFYESVLRESQAARAPQAQGAAVPDPVPPVEERESAWIDQVRGFMTIGSPIDKHLTLWEGMWKDLPISDEAREARGVHLRKGQIRWRNYYDYGDPVGFMLDSARHWLWTKKRCTAFEFCACPDCGHDIGFARYFFPGKAHNDYWEDDEVFEHFITNVVLAAEADGEDAAAKVPPGSKPAVAPVSKGLVYAISPWFPYLLSFLLIGIGAFIVYRAVSGYTNPEFDPSQRYVFYQTLGISPPEFLARQWQVLTTLGIAFLIGGTTVLARVPRLARQWPPRLRALGVFLAGCALYWLLAHPVSRAKIGEVFRGWGTNAPTLGVLLLAFFVAVLAIIVSRKPGKDGPWNWLKHKLWWAFAGMRPLILLGALGMLLIVAQRLGHADAWLADDLRARLGSAEPPRHWLETFLTPHETQERTPLTPAELRDKLLPPAALAKLSAAARAQPVSAAEFAQMLDDPRLKLVTVHPPIWPVVLASAAFLYLWWLGALIFDLSFVWQRYIRNAVLAHRIREATGGRAEKARGAEQCQNPKRGKMPPAVRAGAPAAAEAP